MSVRRSVLVLLIALMALDAQAPRPASAQNLLPMALGTAAGFGAGGYISIGIVTARARQGKYIYYATDALGWQAAPTILGGITGLALGTFAPDRLERSVIYGAIGGFAGAGLGLAYGAIKWDPPEGEWAGAVIGSAAGLAVGALVGMLVPVPEEELVEGETAAQRPRGLPILIRLPF